MEGFEQLALDLAVVPRHLSRRPAHVWLRLARLLTSLLAGLAVAGACATLFPYRTSIAGVPITVSATVTPSHRGISVDSSVGNLQFRDVSALPFGVHVSPRIDLASVRAVTAGGPAFSSRARHDLAVRVPRMVWHFAVALLTGLLLGCLAGGLLFDGTLLLLMPRVARQDRARRRRLRATAFAAAGLTAVSAGVLGGLLLLTYRPDWSTRYAVTGLLVDVASTPAQLASLDARDAGAADKLRAVLRLQDALTKPVVDSTTPAAAFRILFISDIHRRDIYPYLRQYIDANDVSLIVNTGDETLVGSTSELTRNYVAAVQAVTARTPMVWVKGNHDSPAIARAMDRIPGVTVLDGTVVNAYGLQIYGIGDPRNYGAPGDAGSDTPRVVTAFENRAAERALTGIDRNAYLDLLVAHEPVEADALASSLGASVRAQASGHLHHQNPERDLQAGGRAPLRLVEGSTGLGGLFADAGDPMEFSIMSVTSGCQFTRIVRYALSDPALPTESRLASFGASSSFTVHYFSPQPISPDRLCSDGLGVGAPLAADSPRLRSVQEWAAAAAGPRTPGPVTSARPVAAGDPAKHGPVATAAPSPTSDLASP